MNQALNNVCIRPLPKEGPDWKQHPDYEGVFLKPLVTYETTQGHWRCLLVRVQPGATLVSHVHDQEDEIHYVIEGAGRADIGANILDYRIGSLQFISSGITHSVKAGAEGLIMLAQFVRC